MTDDWQLQAFSQVQAGKNTTVKVAAVAKQRERQKRRRIENNAAFLQMSFFVVGNVTSQKIILDRTGGLQVLLWVLSNNTQNKASWSTQHGRLVCLNHLIPDYTVDMEHAAQRCSKFFSKHEMKQLGFLLSGRLPGLEDDGNTIYCNAVILCDPPLLA